MAGAFVGCVLISFFDNFLSHGLINLLKLLNLKINDQHSIYGCTLGRGCQLCFFCFLYFCIEFILIVNLSLYN